MSETVKHTPGEWVAKWSKYSDGEFIVQTDHPSNRVIASFDDDGDGAGEQSIADAHLIAAAPNLLAAAELLHKWFEITGSSVNQRWERIPPEDRAAIVAATKAAIAKAGG